MRPDECLETFSGSNAADPDDANLDRFAAAWRSAMIAQGRREDVQRSWAEIRPDRLVEIACAMIDIPSPSGGEGPLARRVVDLLNDAGLAGQEQPIDAQQSNAIGGIAGHGDSPSLLLYAPIDTVTVGSEAEDLPWAGPELRADMRAASWTDGLNVFGLGAQNPKGHAACVLAAAEAIRKAGIALKGDLRLGFGAGGMPTMARTGTRLDNAHGAGCMHMLAQGPKPDFAIIAKSGWSVSWEEVGFLWLEIDVHGAYSYVGSRHLLPYVGAVHDAARVVIALEDWFPEWTRSQTSGLVAPQGVVSVIEGGWKRMPAFTPALCRLIVDLRLSPRLSAEQAERIFAERLADIARTTGCRMHHRVLVAIPGTHTPPDNWIIKASIDAWEEIEERPHRPVVGLSGSTDANILRMAGIPTARVGLTKADLPDLDFSLGMNAVSIQDMVRLTRHLIHVVIATCGDARMDAS